MKFESKMKKAKKSFKTVFRAARNNIRFHCKPSGKTAALGEKAKIKLKLEPNYYRN